MAMKEGATTTHRLHVQTAKLTESLTEKDNKDVSPPGLRLGSNIKRKPEVTLESLYLQKNYKDPSSTPLETIFESPRPSKGWASPDSALLMASKKLKRLCIFPSHHQLPRNKLKQRRERALKMKRLTGVQIPLGKAFSEDDVLAVLSCLTEEETATSCLYQEQEREVLDLSNTSTCDQVEGMISVLNSLQMDCEPSLAPQSQAFSEAASFHSRPSRERKQRRKYDLIPQVKVVTPPASTSTHQSPPMSHPPKTAAWVKRLKWRSGFMFPQKSSSPLSPVSGYKTSTSIRPSQSSRKVAKPKGMGKNMLIEMEQHTMSTKITHLKLGSKRNPDNTLASSTKKQCTHKSPQETNTDLSPFLQHSKEQGKEKKRVVSRVKHYNIFAHETPSNNTLSSSIVPTSCEQKAASMLSQEPFSSLLPSLSALKERDLSLTLLNPLVSSGCSTDDGGGEGERGVGKEGATSPSSPSSRLAALSLHSSPKQHPSLIKPKKVQQRSARLSIGSDVIEGLQKIQNDDNGSCDVPLGTVWAASSPLEQKAEVNRPANSTGEDSGNDPVLPPASSSTTKKWQSKGKRQSSLYSQLQMMDTMRKRAKTTSTESNSDAANFSFQPISPSPISLHSPAQVPTSHSIAQGPLTTSP